MQKYTFLLKTAQTIPKSRIKTPLYSLFLQQVVYTHL